MCVCVFATQTVAMLFFIFKWLLINVKQKEGQTSVKQITVFNLIKDT